MAYTCRNCEGISIALHYLVTTLMFLILHAVEDPPSAATIAENRPRHRDRRLSDDDQQHEFPWEHTAGLGGTGEVFLLGKLPFRCHDSIVKQQWGTCQHDKQLGLLSG